MAWTLILALTKSRLIYLISVFSIAMLLFLFKQGVAFGNYRDIVSANAADKSYFRVGLIEKGNDNRFSGFLMTFIEMRGIPFLHKYASNFYASDWRHASQKAGLGAHRRMSEFWERPVRQLLGTPASLPAIKLQQGCWRSQCLISKRLQRQK